MFGALIKKIFGSKSQRDVKRLEPMVEKINNAYVDLESLSDEELIAKTQQFKTLIQERTQPFREEIDAIEAQLKGDFDGDIDDIRNRFDALQKNELEAIETVLMEILPEAFAVVKDTCRRLVGKTWKVVGQDVTWDMVPFDVQLMGGIVLHEGKIAEMATGEGKTLVATMPAYLNALVGKGVHVITVNDYLARRDCEWMGEIFKFLGLTVSFITNDMPPQHRSQAYKADVTYGTNNEFGFDYLRDNMAVQIEGLVQRKHHYAIIDEVDSVLIDEARTPLIISGPVGESRNKFAEMKPLVEQLVRNQTYLVNRLIADGEKLFKEGKEYDAGIKLLQAQRGAPKSKRLIKLAHEPGIQKLIRHVESDYMRDKILHELDEELYFAIDEKNHTIDLTDKGRASLAPNNPELFVLPDLATELSALEGDDSLSPEEREKKKEKIQVEYADKSEQLHNISQLLRAYSLFEKDNEYVVTEDDKVMIVDEFTGRLMPGRRFSDGLHQALEAKENVRIERETQTFATITLQNFFRLYNKLAGMTGTAETEAGEFWEIYKLDVVVIPTNEPIRRDDMDDVVYRTKREKYNAIMDVIEDYHNNKQPVLVGTISVEVSETLSRMLKRRGIPHSVLNAKHHRQEAEIVSKSGEPGHVTIATNMAGRGTDIKLGAQVIYFDDEMLESLVEDVQESISSSGTVFVHELSDLDIKRFLNACDTKGIACQVVDSLSLKKQLMARTMTPEAPVVIIAKGARGPNDAKIWHDNWSHLKVRDYALGGLHILGTERHESRRIDRQLRGRAGRQGDPGSSRFFLSLEDDLMRLFGSERIASVMDRMGVEEGEVITHPMITKSIERAQKRVETRNFEIRKHLLEYDDVMNKQREVIYNRRRRALEGQNLHQEILELLEDHVYALIQNHTAGEDYYENWDLDALQEALGKSLLLPLPIAKSDAANYNVQSLTDRILDAARSHYKRKQTFLGSDLMGQLERFATLKTIDDRWKEHLYEMDRLKEGIGLRAYGQKDPLIEYKQEGFHTFTEMIETINREIVEIVFKAQVQTEHEPRPTRRTDPMQMSTVHEESVGMGFAGSSEGTADGPPQAGKKQPVRVMERVGRNDPCPCGSGKKFKHCHGQ